MSHKLEALCFGCFRVQNWENGERIHTISFNKIVGNTASQLKQKSTKISTGRMSLLQYEESGKYFEDGEIYEVILCNHVLGLFTYISLTD